VQRTAQPYHFAKYPYILCDDGAHFGVLRLKPDGPFFFVEGLYRGFVVDKCHYDIAVFRGLLLPHKHKISVMNTGADHAVTFHLKHKHVLASHK
jgi:hypothetical protein